MAAMRKRTGETMQAAAGKHAHGMPVAAEDGRAQRNTAATHREDYWQQKWEWMPDPKRRR